MIEKKTQKAGDGSVNLLAENVNIRHGVDYGEARQIAHDVFEANFYKLAGEAREAAKARAEELVDDFLERLALTSPNTLDVASDPDMQYAIYAAQKQYARTGDKQLSDILVDILVRRANEKDRSMRQVVLNESIDVAPKLVDYQFDILSIIMFYKYMRRTSAFNGFEEFLQYLTEMTLPFMDGLKRAVGDSPYSHMEYAGCGSMQNIGGVPLEQILRANYPGMFYSGFTREQLTNMGEEIMQWAAEMLVPCIHDPAKYQFNVLHDSEFEMLAERKGYGEKVKGSFRSLQNGNMLAHTDIKEIMTSALPWMDELFNIWGKSQISRFTLTTVGIAIAQANIKRRLGFEVDLEIWIT